jgi:hypothetical protein
MRLSSQRFEQTARRVSYAYLDAQRHSLICLEEGCIANTIYRELNHLGENGPWRGVDQQRAQVSRKPSKHFSDTHLYGQTLLWLSYSCLIAVWLAPLRFPRFKTPLTTELAYLFWQVFGLDFFTTSVTERIDSQT